MPAFNQLGIIDETKFPVQAITVEKSSKNTHVAINMGRATLKITQALANLLKDNIAVRSLEITELRQI